MDPTGPTNTNIQPNMDKQQRPAARLKDPLDMKQLKIYNSLTRKKELFVANDGKTIKWYCCGPTVYDVAHLGHARCYITFDIIRRILEGYFDYQVYFVMNITDIDDKIIKRARTNYLCDKFIDKFMSDLKASSSASAKQALVAPIKEAFEHYKQRQAGEQDKDKLDMITKVIEDSDLALKELIELLASETNEEKVLALLERLRTPIADEQDALLGHTVNDHQVFKNLTMKFEQEYHDDMSRLDVMPASVTPRVSEYIDEVGEYIVILERNGFAYRSDGSIYFDVEKFDADPKHSYAKLVRGAYGKKKDLDEGEGELSKGAQLGKKSPNDFVLWKKSKVGEPSWQTQDFDAGRPGWHIECSVMASKLLGGNFDIHSGGHDLRFPHHDNEIAQAEAYYNTGDNWVNYFLHSGHLTISGCKMSKSLKNFITIRQALNEYTSRQLRFAFLAHRWTEPLDYSPNTMSIALGYEKTFRQFFLNQPDADYDQEDPKLSKEFTTTVSKVHTALCDNFDTRNALNALTTLVKLCNKRQKVSLTLMREISAFIERVMSSFGTKFEPMCKYVKTLGQFRAEVRTTSKGADATESIQKILGLCIDVRDKTLPELGVRLEDTESGDGSYVVKFVDAETQDREPAALKIMEALAQFRAEVLKISKGADAKENTKELLNLCDRLRDQTLPELGIALQDRDSYNRSFFVDLVD